ncbi:MAG TPA: hypothetical protein VK916_01455 [Gillisia sp.]|nr:hypothetical protein [Gillisia sp.]
MKIEHIEERVNEYRNSIKTVVEKRILWNTQVKILITEVLKKAEETYNIGWRVQELNWVHTNEAVNITFDSFPPDLIEKTNLIPAYQFLKGGSLIFSQLYNGDIEIFVLFPVMENWNDFDKDMEELGTYPPAEINEKLVVEKLDEFLKEMIRWEVPLIKTKLGYKNQ